MISAPQISASHMKALKAAAKQVAQGSNSELKKAGDRLVKAAKEERVRRAGENKKYSDHVAKDLGSYIVRAPVSFSGTSEKYKRNFDKIDWSKK